MEGARSWRVWREAARDERPDGRSRALHPTCVAPTTNEQPYERFDAFCSAFSLIGARPLDRSSR